MFENTFWMDFNGKRNVDLDIQVVQRPNIPAPKKKVNFIEIAGRDGALTETDDVYENITISVPLNFLTKRNEHFMDQARAAKNWIDGDGILKFSDDIDVFYKVKNASIDGNIERALWRAGTFSALFVCDPYTYYESGRVKSQLADCLVNPYKLSKPTYYITGNGNCTLTVNGNTVSANIGQNLIIDTELMMMYRENGQVQNTLARCIYKDFYLKPGKNTISITNGFTLRICPNWRSL